MEDSPNRGSERARSRAAARAGLLIELRSGNRWFGGGVHIIIFHHYRKSVGWVEGTPFFIPFVGWIALSVRLSFCLWYVILLAERAMKVNLSKDFKFVFFQRTIQLQMLLNPIYILVQARYERRLVPLHRLDKSVYHQSGEIDNQIEGSFVIATPKTHASNPLTDPYISIDINDERSIASNTKEQ